MKKPIAKWILIVSYLFALMGLMVGVSSYLLPPESVVPSIPPGTKGTDLLMQMIGARQIAIGAILGYSAFSKSISMLKIAFIAYLLMQIQDGAIGIVQNDMGLAISAGVVGSISVFILFKLYKHPHA